MPPLVHLQCLLRRRAFVNRPQANSSGEPPARDEVHRLSWRGSFASPPGCRTPRAIWQLHENGSSSGISRIKSSQIQFNEALTLFFADVEVAMDINEMLKASDLAGKPIRATERLGREGCQMIDVLGLTIAKKGPQQRIVENAVVKTRLKSMERFFTSSVFIKRWHEQKSTVRSGVLVTACPRDVPTIGDRTPTRKPPPGPAVLVSVTSFTGPWNQGASVTQSRQDPHEGARRRPRIRNLAYTNCRCCFVPLR